MDLMIPRIQLYSDLQNHTYFFEKPDFSSEIAVNFKSKVVKEPEKARDTLNHLLESFAQLDDEFSHKEISKI